MPSTYNCFSPIVRSYTYTRGTRIEERELDQVAARAPGGGDPGGERGTGQYVVVQAQHLGKSHPDLGGGTAGRGGPGTHISRQRAGSTVWPAATARSSFVHIPTDGHAVAVPVSGRVRQQGRCTGPETHRIDGGSEPPVQLNVRR